MFRTYFHCDIRQRTVDVARDACSASFEVFFQRIFAHWLPAENLGVCLAPSGSFEKIQGKFRSFDIQTSPSHSSGVRQMPGAHSLSIKLWRGGDISKSAFYARIRYLSMLFIGKIQGAHAPDQKSRGISAEYLALPQPQTQGCVTALPPTQGTSVTLMIYRPLNY